MYSARRPLSQLSDTAMVNPPNLRARAARRRTLLLAMGAAAALVATLPFHVSAQRVSSRTSGLFIGAHLEGASLKVEDSDRSNGAGAGVVAGWVFGNGIGVFTQFDRSNVDVRNQPDTEGSWSITQFDAGLRYYFKRPQSTVVPYLQGSGTYRDVRVEELPGSPGSAVDVSGTGFTAGAGVDLHITPSVAFEFALLFTFGSLKDAELDGAPIDGFESVSAQSSRFNLGLTWWPTD